MNQSQRRALIALSACMTLLLYKYLLQLFPSVMTTQLMDEYQLSGAQLGNLAACFFYGYLIMQVFAGPLVDRFGVRSLASISLLCAATGVVIFTLANYLLYCMLGRCLMGVGASFATICYLRCSKICCSAKTLAFAGGCLTIGVMLGACLGTYPLALLLNQWGVQQALLLVAGIGCLLAVVNYLSLPAEKGVSANKQLIREIKSLLNRRENWLLAGYSGFAFAPLAVFGGLWGTPFLHVSHHFTTAHAAGLVSLCYVGFGFGGPVFGYLSDQSGNRRFWMLTGVLLSLVFLSAIIFLPINNTWFIACLMFGLGFATGSFMLGFTYGKEINSPLLAGSIVAFINSGDALLGAVTEPFIGKLLDLGQGPVIHGHELFSTHDFKMAFIPLVIYLLMAMGFVLFLPKKGLNLT